tara:strand:- start:152 stop:406 length:255 start_codon:yes stop_codon:yes gene_type:complete
MEDMVIGLAARPDVLIGLLGLAGYTTLCTVCSALSKLMPDTITKDSTLLGMRIGKLRCPYNKTMKFINKVALNTGKATNNPEVQ